MGRFSSPTNSFSTGSYSFGPAKMLIFAAVAGSIQGYKSNENNENRIILSNSCPTLTILQTNGKTEGTLMMNIRPSVSGYCFWSISASIFVRFKKSRVICESCMSLTSIKPDIVSIVCLRLCDCFSHRRPHASCSQT